MCRRFLRVGFQALGIGVLLAVAIPLISLMLPIKIWRTGEIPMKPLPLYLAKPFATPPMRVWIDTDAACGHAQRTDPDDCFAILLLARQNTIEVVGISTVFGNAPLDDTDRITRLLADLIGKEQGRSIPVYRGASTPLDPQRPPHAGPAHDAMIGLHSALKQGPLTILALGPLTNIAGALKDRPQLQANVTRLVAVMGRREGHLFHPVEGGTAHSFLGHGPVFRDFNFTEDEEAATLVVSMGLPTTLVPYEAARSVTVNATTLTHMADLGGAAEWVSQQARPWLTYWREDIGRNGFYPFDLIAAAYVVDPSLLHCTDAPIVVQDDEWVFGWLGYRGLFIILGEQSPTRVYAAGSTLYCPEVSEQFEERVLAQGWLMSTHEKPMHSGQLMAIR